MRVGILNRGEVAVRIIRACQELGHTSVLMHSTPDKNTAAYRMADEVIELPGQTSMDTYLNIPLVIESAIAAKLDLLHPGFGFLSENSSFVSELEKTNIKFVGPTSKAIALAGNKIKAKEAAFSAGVPIIPAYSGNATDPQELLSEAIKIGFPCMIKAAAGGGGKGMRLVQMESEFIEKLEAAKREARNSFGNDTVFIEKVIENPRHIEVQIFLDSHGHGVHFYERDCTIQRRHQKIFEESPSVDLLPNLRKQICDSALKLAKSVGYTNAGTVEFLVDESGHYFFMELNTRLQVEHPVTELVCGVDLVHLQFQVAIGNPLNLTQEQIRQRGHALEVRIYAEDPEREFLPSTGTILKRDLPLGPGRRFDFGYEAGDQVTPHYDPMVGKIITWAPTRAENLDRMYNTLCETVIFGIKTNIEFLKKVLTNSMYRTNDIHTGFLEEQYKDGFRTPPLNKAQNQFVEEARNLAKSSTPSSKPITESPWTHSWSQK